VRTGLRAGAVVHSNTQQHATMICCTAYACIERVRACDLGFHLPTADVPLLGMVGRYHRRQLLRNCEGGDHHCGAGARRRRLWFYVRCDRRARVRAVRRHMSAHLLLDCHHPFVCRYSTYRRCRSWPCVAWLCFRSSPVGSWGSFSHFSKPQSPNVAKDVRSLLRWKMVLGCTHVISEIARDPFAIRCVA
jgi:hypothetical protein